MKKNQRRGKEHKHPVTYSECMEIAKRVLTTNKVDNSVGQ